MKQQINQIETTKVLADPLRPKTKATIVIVVSLIAAGALFAGTAAFGIYSRNQWPGTVQQRTNQAARLLVGVIRPEKSTGMISLLRHRKDRPVRISGRHECQPSDARGVKRYAD